MARELPAMALCRNASVTTSGNHVPLLGLRDLIRIAHMPGCLNAASDVAKRDYPRSELARVA